MGTSYCWQGLTLTGDHHVLVVAHFLQNLQREKCVSSRKNLAVNLMVKLSAESGFTSGQFTKDRQSNEWIETSLI